MSMRKSPTMGKSLNNFLEPNGVVGLGILAAMKEMDRQDPIISNNKPSIVVVSPRSSKPISFFSQRNDSFCENVGKKRPSLEEMEMCEEYTCVISHVGNNWVKKREYFDGDFLGVVEGSAEDFGVAFGGCDSGSVNGSAMGHGGGDVAEGWTDDFLDSCSLCKKNLHGLDIFMYRGEKAFCSAECRDKQISADEHKEKLVTGVMKPSEHSDSPCSSPMQFVAGVAAA